MSKARVDAENFGHLHSLLIRHPCPRAGISLHTLRHFSMLHQIPAHSRHYFIYDFRKENKDEKKDGEQTTESGEQNATKENKEETKQEKTEDVKEKDAKAKSKSPRRSSR